MLINEKDILPSGNILKSFGHASPGSPRPGNRGEVIRSAPQRKRKRQSQKNID